MKPVIEFQKYRIKNIDYRVVDNIDELKTYDEKNGKISLAIGLNESKDKAQLTVSTCVSDSDNLRVADISVIGYFEINPEVEQEEIEQYLVQNGTAILFPYLRTTISFITSLDNDKAIIIPTINTIGLFEEESEED
nr:protein-export chaperone SecB [Lactococcus lactis]